VTTPPDHPDHPRSSTQHEIRDNTDANRFELFVDGNPAVVLEYRAGPGGRANAYSLVHTETQPGFDGRGLASELVTAVLEQLREQGSRIRPYCPFVTSFLRKHPDYLELVAAEDRERFGLPAA